MAPELSPATMSCRTIDVVMTRSVAKGAGPAAPPSVRRFLLLVLVQNLALATRVEAHRNEVLAEYHHILHAKIADVVPFGEGARRCDFADPVVLDCLEGIDELFAIEVRACPLHRFCEDVHLGVAGYVEQ